MYFLMLKEVSSEKRRFIFYKAFFDQSNIAM